MPARAISSIPKSTALAHPCSQQMKFPLDIMHNIFAHYISGERDLPTALLLTHVDPKVRYEAFPTSDSVLIAIPLHRNTSRDPSVPPP
ncbi:hypothetical protein FIBSPDRAFT_970830 [Athelia psychrophila]|uniref:Uncharacterized protein n=1 Tax=Athelia psychrophila TaxID=1759441 RepID=A0A167SHM1_9AGAM|nr:hypothetical protein FIBSPDRAFT_970830 [Fibularhizoctonia sp. CBS 109695]